MKPYDSTPSGFGFPPGSPISFCKTRAAALLRAFALVLPGVVLPPAIGSALDLQAWQKAIKQTHPSQAGCFQASYPDTQWRQVSCAQPQDAVPPWRTPPGKGDAKNTQLTPIWNTGYSASAVGGPIWNAEGSFLGVTGVTSIMDSVYDPGGNSYSLQVNTDYFTIPGSSSLCGNHAGCMGWVQFAYQNYAWEGRGLIAIWYWIGGANSCQAPWISYDNWCYSYHAMNTPLQPVSNFNDQINLGGQTVNGEDTINITIGGQAYSATTQSRIQELPQLWEHAQFNVFGIGNSSSANFNSGAMLTINTRIDNGTGNAPICASDVGTGEDNNLYYNSPCCSYAGGKPSIAFVEGTEDNPGKFTCADLGSNTIVPVVTPAEGGTIAPSVALQVPNRAVSTFTVVPSDGYKIDSVTGCGGLLNGGVFTTAPATGDCTVTAMFVSSAPANTYTVTASAGAGGTISPSGGLSAPAGTVQKFTVTPGLGYSIASVDGTCGGTLNGNIYTTLAITADCTVTAAFKAQSYIVTASVNGTGGKIDPSGYLSVKSGATQSFTVTPDANYQIASVDGTCGGSLKGNTYTTSPITANCTTTATFAPSSYTVTARAGANGAIDPSGSLSTAFGTTRTFTLTPDVNYTVFLMRGTCEGTLNGNTFTTKAITSDCTVIASFTPNYYVVTASAGAGGAINPSGYFSTVSGTTRTFTLTPNANYQISTVGGTCGGTLNGNTFTTKAITSNCVVMANFTPN